MSIPLPPFPAVLSLALIPAFFALHRAFSRIHRTTKLPTSSERVLILGASSGIGRSIAHQYAERGARGIMVVGRRADQINEVVEECREIAKNGKSDVLGVPGDFSNVDDMIRIRERLKSEWGGVDTLIVAAGVSALKPLMAVAGLEEDTHAVEDASRDGMQHAVDIASAALKANYFGPLVSAISLIPLLQNTSPAPSILLVSSLAAVIPPPTRTLYASTKAASLTLYQALAVEHPQIAFSFVLPATVEGDFRASAVDGGRVREADPNTTGLKRTDVARRCISAIDYGEKQVFMPASMRFGQLLYWIWPTFVEKKAAEKYNFIH